MVRLQENLEFACRKLAGLPSARLEAEILLAHTLESPRSFLYANPNLDLPSKRVDAFKKLVRRRAQGEPIAYITGNREFWSLPLKITPDVLIPRHETELLVESALQRIPEFGVQRIADLGTGCGAIALAIASERPACELHGTDISPAAVSLASENAKTLGLSGLHFHLGSWCEPLDGTFSVIVSNPPYIAANDPHLEQGDCRFEPGNALTPGTDALSAFRNIATQAFDKLGIGGSLLFEHGPDQAAQLQELFLQSGYRAVETFRDLSGHERVTSAQKQV